MFGSLRRRLRAVEHDVAAVGDVADDMCDSVYGPRDEDGDREPIGLCSRLATAEAAIAERDKTIQKHAVLIAELQESRLRRVEVESVLLAQITKLTARVDAQQQTLADYDARHGCHSVALSDLREAVANLALATLKQPRKKRAA